MREVNGVPELNTANLILRRLNHEDRWDLFLMRSNPGMIKYADGKLDRDINDTLEYINRMNQGVDDKKWIAWGIGLKKEGVIIGTISLWNLNEDNNSGELGYGLNPDYHGKGHMREALKRVVEFGFEEFDLSLIFAYTDKDNIPSNKLLENCGFMEVDRIKESGFHSDRVFDYIVYRKDRGR